MRSELMKWWDRRNAAFTHLCGEDFTNGDVVMAHAGVVVLLLACVLAEWIGGAPW